MKALGRFSRACVLVLLVRLFVPGAALAEDGPLAIIDVRATAYPQVTVRLTVSSARGELLPVLTSEDFAVEENGEQVASVIAYPLNQSPTPVNVAIAFDVSGTMTQEGRLAAAKAAAKTFVAQLRRIDQVEVISFGQSVNVVAPFTHDRAAVDRGIDNLGAKGDVAFHGVTDRAVNDVLRIAGTRLVVLITDGQNMASEAQLAPALDLARQTQVPIYTIGVGTNADDAVLGRMASETGGHYFKAPKAADLATSFQLLEQNLANQYELSYASSLDLQPGQKVDVAVSIPRVGDGLRATFSYVVPAVRRQASGPVDPGQLQPVVEPTPVLDRLPQLVLPNSSMAQVAALLTAAAVFALLVGILLRTTRDRTEIRLAAFVAGVGRLTRRGSSNEPGGGLMVGLLNSLAGVATWLLPANQIEQVRRNLILAGSPYGWGVQEFLGVRTLIAILFGLVGYVYGAPRGPFGILAGVIVMGLLGFLLPDLWLGSRIRRRQQAIFRAMPNALDLISVSVEAGLGFDQALTEVCQKWQNDLTHEFALFLGEVRMGRDRREALRAIAERTGVTELNGFIGAVLQADELGSGIARTLLIQAEQMRIKRRQAAEKLAHEAAIKMLFPMVFLIFPAIFVVILGPAVPTILGAFQNIKH